MRIQKEGQGLTIQLITLPEAKADAPEGSVPVLDLTHLGKFKLVRYLLLHIEDDN